MAKGFNSPRRIRERTQRAVRETAVQIMNDLAEAGPEWSGKLKNAWVADTFSGRGKQKLGKKTSYPYSEAKGSVPALKTDIKSTEATPTKVEIRNDTPYLAYAADLIPGKFWPKEGGPKGVPTTGKRNTSNTGLGFRGDLSGEGTNISTAPLDWLATYLKGGGMQRATEKSIRFFFGGR